MIDELPRPSHGFLRDQRVVDVAADAVQHGELAHLVASALFGVLSQRLVRQVCPQCHGKGTGPQGGRCRNCSGSGYRGRTGIYELLRIDDELRSAIVEKRPSGEINEIARRNGMIPLLEDGQNKVVAGITTEAELLRIAAGV